jgi:hypothetical protein
MRKLYILIVLPIFLYSTSLSYAEITKMVQKIKQERSGIDLNVLDSTPNPFAIEEVIIPPKEVKAQKVKTQIVEEHYELTAILNHKAFINQEWYEIGDKIGSYTVHSIGYRSVILKNRVRSRKLIIEDTKKRFKMFKGN